MFDKLYTKAKSLGQYVSNKVTAITIATAATLAGAGAASASTASATSVTTPTFSSYDVINSIANQVFPAILPILSAGAIVFGAWWIWHRVRGAMS